MYQVEGWNKGILSPPYLFLLCIKGLISLLSKYISKLQIVDIKVIRGPLSIDYLLFTDDSVIFYNVDVDTTKKIQKLLIEYERALGQCTNSNKTIAVLSKNTSTDTKEELITL